MVRFRYLTCLVRGSQVTEIFVKCIVTLHTLRHIRHFLYPDQRFSGCDGDQPNYDPNHLTNSRYK